MDKFKKKKKNIVLFDFKACKIPEETKSSSMSAILLCACKRRRLFVRLSCLVLVYKTSIFLFSMAFLFLFFYVIANSCQHFSPYKVWGEMGICNLTSSTQQVAKKCLISMLTLWVLGFDSKWLMCIILCKRAVSVICNALWAKRSLLHLYIVHLKLYSTYDFPAYLMSSVLCLHISIMK